MNELISVIVPIYKVEPYIFKCINSICEQTHKNLEILLVDDGSPDGCGKICDEFAGKDDRIRVFHIQNGGQSHARNVGLEAATGDYIGFVDGDDMIQPDMYEKLLSLMIGRGADITECNFHGRKQPLPDTMTDEEIVELTGRDAIIRQLDVKITSRFPSTSVWSKLFRKTVIDGMRLPDGKIHEEYAFLCEAFLNAKKYVYVNECLYERTLRKDSTTAEKFSARTLDKIYVYQMRNHLLADRGEWELHTLSKEQEFELLLFYASKAKQSGLENERRLIEQLIDSQKKEIQKSDLRLKKKVLYGIYFMNKHFYYLIKKDK